ncbi:hypothetical protein [Paraburkholderia solisilvae]|uniref:hypothetical protein n=1 Tax=Paraburkholderia solisilvae TaxID=624376 RepID=UPI001583CFF1|nr:hypothetical protein [Paraburkholderia solisilvae]
MTKLSCCLTLYKLQHEGRRHALKRNALKSIGFGLSAAAGVIGAQPAQAQSSS